MRLVHVMCSEVLADSVREALSEFCGNEGCFTELQRVHATVKGVRRMDSPAFPGTANLFFIPVEDAELPRLRVLLSRIRDKTPTGCLKAIELEGHDLLAE